MNRIRFEKSLFTIVTFLFLSSAMLSQSTLDIQIDDIDIVRDQWGVPHVFAPTDVEVAYGFGWASAEDDVKTIQLQILPIRGVTGEVMGKEGALADVLVHILEVNRVVDTQYEKEISPEFKAYLDAYSAGVSAYLKKHPQELLHKKVLPLTGKDIAKAFVLGVSLMARAPENIIALFQNEIDPIDLPERGSNAFAFSSAKTTDGKTYLAINSHQPLEGPNSWYEAHLCSEEGMNILGGCFAGSPIIEVGVNEQLGWAHTVNFPDFSDVFQLEMHPTKEHVYRFDNEWLPLEEYHTKAIIKILGFLKIGKKQKFYKSKYGVTFKTENGYFAIRFPANSRIGSPEQWYRMGKANSWKEFKAALDMQQLPALNIVYADRDDNIFYLGNGLFPKRPAGYNWQEVVPGNSSKTLWSNTDYYPVDSLAYVFNPASGYVYNCNHTPFVSSGEADNPKESELPKNMGYLPKEQLTNRAVRFEALLAPHDKVSYNDFKRIKYDRAYHTPLLSAPKLEPIFHLSEEKYPELKESIALLKNWNRETEIESEGAALFVLSLQYIRKKISSFKQLRTGNEVNEALLVEAIRDTRAHCLKYFGKVHVPLKQVQRHTRGEVSLPVSGGPDVLAAMDAARQKDGTYRAMGGDSYIELVRFSKKGVEIESVNAYGASAKPDSPHYTDQMKMYVDRKLKPMTLDKEKVYQQAVRIYHPE